MRFVTATIFLDVLEMLTRGSHCKHAMLDFQALASVYSGSCRGSEVLKVGMMKFDKIFSQEARAGLKCLGYVSDLQSFPTRLCSRVGTRRSSHLHIQSPLLSFHPLDSHRLHKLLGRHNHNQHLLFILLSRHQQTSDNCFSRSRWQRRTRRWLLQKPQSILWPRVSNRT